MQEPFFYRRTAQYHETDQMGIIHHANYIKWMEEARVHLMERIGHSYRAMEDEGVYSPVLDVTCTYLRKVRFNDRIRIYVSLKSRSRVRFVLHYAMYNDSDGGVLCTEGTTMHCFYRRSSPSRPCDLLKEMQEFFDSFPPQEKTETAARD